MIPIPDISQVYPKTSLMLDSRFVVGEGNARDLSGDANTGTIVSGRTLSLDGTGDHLDGGTIAAHAFTGSFTVSLWAKSSSATEQTFAMKFSGGSTGYQVTLRADQSDAYWQCSIADSTGWTHARANESHSGIPAALDDGVWRHITLRANNGTLEAYVNGVIGGETDTYENTTALGTSGQRFTIGGNYAATPTKLVTGSMCGLKVFNVALSAAQILEQYENPEQVLPTGASAVNLISYWPLADYDNSTANSLDGLYFMDLGTAKSNAKASNCGMDLAEQPPCPQLGLMPSSSLIHFPGDKAIGDSNQWNGYSASWSASFWVFLEAGGSSQFVWEGGGYNGGSPYNGSQRFNIQFYDDGGDMALIFYHDDNGSITAAVYDKTSDFPVGEWLHIGVSWNVSDGSVQLFYEGTKRTDTTPTGLSGSGSSFAFGARYVYSGGTAQTFLNGYIANVGFWNEILDDDEFAALHTAGVNHDYRNASGNYDSQANQTAYYWLDNALDMQTHVGSFPDLEFRTGGDMAISVFPEGATSGETAAGFTKDKRADNAVINLDGHSYVTIPHDVNLNPDLSEGFTCSAWFKMRSLGSGSSTPIFDKDNSNDRWYLRIRDDASDIYQFNFGDGSGTTDISGGTLSDNNWHHVAVTLDYGEDEGIFYVDGAAVGSATDISARGADCPGTDALTIGSDGTTAVLNGAVAYPKIYARVLTANEIKLLYSSGHRVVGGL